MLYDIEWGSKWMSNNNIPALIFQEAYIFHPSCLSAPMVIVRHVLSGSLSKYKALFDW